MTYRAAKWVRVPLPYSLAPEDDTGEVDSTDSRPRASHGDYLQKITTWVYRITVDYLRLLPVKLEFDSPWTHARQLCQPGNQLLESLLCWVG